MTIIDRTSCPADCSLIKPRAVSLRGALPKSMSLCAISLALALGACAQNPAPQPVAANSPQARNAQARTAQVRTTQVKTDQVKTASLPAPPVHRHLARRDPSVQIRNVDAALLAPQPAPNCEYKKSDIKTVDADEWARLKSEYELQCYRETEAAARTRLGLLQSSVRRLQN
jgi:hypothetical protein